MYTAHCDPEIEKTIDRHMHIISKEIRAHVTDVESIVLAGGFGRGEGSVVRLPEGGYLPVNDYDMYVVSDSTVPFSVAQRLRVTLSNTIGIRVDIKFIKTNKLEFLIPDMFTFELKTASRIIWGKDLRSNIRIRKEDVPLSVCLNTLFIEILGLIEYFEPKYFDQEIPADRSLMLNYVLTKVYIEICNALSLFGNFYDPSIAKKADLLDRYFLRKFPELANVLPDLPARVRKHTEKKLRSFEFNAVRPMKLWLEARKHVEYTLMYLICKILREPFEQDLNLPEYFRVNRKQITSFFFEPYLNYLLNRFGIGTNVVLINILMPEIMVYENLRFMRNCLSSMGRIFLKPLLRFESPLIGIYLAALYLLNCIDVSGQIRLKGLGKAHAVLSSIFPCNLEYDSAEVAWQILRDACLESHKTYAAAAGTIAIVP